MTEGSSAQTQVLSSAALVQRTYCLLELHVKSYSNSNCSPRLQRIDIKNKIKQSFKS